MYKKLYNEIEKKLTNISIPDIGLSLSNENVVKKININNNQLYIEISLNFPLNEKNKKSLKDILNQSIFSIVNKHKLTLNIIINWKILSYIPKNKVNKLSNIKNIIAVASGKGGVGKSTVSVNLALSLKRLGAKVGILDADLHSPSIPLMLGKNLHNLNNSKNAFQSVVTYGIHSMSIGYLVEKNDPVVWRGPVLNNVFLQLMNQTQWPELDFLIIDLPPGTGDIQLTLSKKVPITGVIIVSTPQKVAIQSAKKSISMFNKVGVNIIGVVENMGAYICPKCHYKEEYLLKKSVQSMANDNNLSFLGSIPYDFNLMSKQNDGCPILEYQPSSEISEKYIDIAVDFGVQLSNLKQDFSISTKTQILAEI